MMQMDNDFINKDDIVKVTPVRLDVLKIEFAKRKLCDCFEPKYEIDYQNRLVWCTECKAIVDPFEALLHIARNHDRINRQHEAMLKERESVAGYNPRMHIIKKLAERYGNKRNPLIPCCPICREPFELQDIVSSTWVNRSYLGERESEE